MTLAESTVGCGMLAFVLGAAACSPATPATPSYAKDLAPIFAAHCNRCHSGRGPDGSTQGDPMTGKKPAGCKFDFYDGDPTMCAIGPDGGTVPIACWGAHYCAVTFSTLVPKYIRGEADPMPPSPASLMSDWEIDVVGRWISNPIP